MRCSALVLTALFFVAAASAPSAALATDLEDFDLARRAYEAQDYDQAIVYFEALVGGAVPRLASPTLVLEARKYLGASYLFVGRRDAARDQFEQLLRADRTYVLDPLRFPVEIVELFEATRERVEFELDQEAQRAALMAERDVERARAEALLEIADRPVEARVEHSRLLALLPFGIGQFQNGDEGGGWGFLISETAFVLVGAGGLIWYTALQEQVRQAYAVASPDDLVLFDTFSDLSLAAQVLNLIGMSTAALLAVGGIIEAQVSFVDSHTVPARIDIPPELRGTPEADGELDPIPAEPAASLSLGIGYLRLRF